MSDNIDIKLNVGADTGKAEKEILAVIDGVQTKLKQSDIENILGSQIDILLKEFNKLNKATDVSKSDMNSLYREVEDVANFIHSDLLSSMQISAEDISSIISGIGLKWKNFVTLSSSLKVKPFEANDEEYHVTYDNLKNVFSMLKDINKLREAKSKRMDSYSIDMSAPKKSLVDKNVWENDKNYIKSTLLDINKEINSTKGMSKKSSIEQTLSHASERLLALKSALANVNFKNLDSESFKSDMSRINEEIETCSSLLQKYSSSLGIYGLSVGNGVSTMRERIVSELSRIESEVTEKIGSINNRTANSGSQALSKGLQGGSAKNLASEYLKVAQSVSSSISSISSKALHGIYKTSVSLIKSSSSLWLRTYKSVFSTIGALFRKTSNSSINGFTSGIKRALSNITPYLSLYGLYNLGKSSLELGGSMVELQNVVDSSFKDMSADIDDFCSNALNKFGLTEKEAKNFSGVFGSMLKSTGIVGQDMATMSKNFSALSGDIASFYNISRNDAFEKLKSGLSGSSIEPLRDLGINMTEANLEAYALSKGITTSYDAMNNASKTALRYNYILDQTRQLQGDFSKTCNSWANQVRVLQGNFQTFMTLLGQGLVKVLYPFIVALNKLMSYVNSAMTALSEKFNFAQVNLEDMFGTGGVQDISGVMENNADSMSDFADSTKKAKGQLAGFDILNNLTDSDKASSKLPDLSNNIGFPIDSYVDNVKEPDTKKAKGIIDKVANKLSEYAGNIANDVNYEPIKKAWSNLLEQIKPLIDDFGKAIDWAWKNVLFPFYKWGAEVGVPACLDLLSEALRSLHLIIQAVAPTLEKFWNESLKPFFSGLGDKFVTTVKGWTESLKEWNDGLEQSTDKMQYLKDTYDRFTAKHFAIGLLLNQTFINIKKLYEYIQSQEGQASLGNAFKTLGEALGKIAAGAIQTVTDWLEWIVTHAEQITSFFDMLVDEFNILGNTQTNFFQEMFEYLLNNKDTVKTILDNLNTTIKNIYDYILDHKDTILWALKEASKFIEGCSEHLGAVIAVVGGAKIASTIGDWVTQAMLFKSALGMLKGAEGAGGLLTTFTGIGEILPTLAFSAGFVATATAVYEMWKEIYDHTKQKAETDKINIDTHNKRVNSKVDKKYKEDSSYDIGKLSTAVDEYNKAYELFSTNERERAFKGTWSIDTELESTDTLLKKVRELADFSSSQEVKKIALSVDETSSKDQIFTAVNEMLTEIESNKKWQTKIAAEVQLDEGSVDEAENEIYNSMSGISEKSTVSVKTDVDQTSLANTDASMTAEMTQIGSNSSEGYKRGLTGNSIWSAISSFFSGLIDGIKSFLGIHSPSTVFAEIGTYCIQGLKNGFSNAWGNFISGIHGMIDNLVSGFSDIGKNFVDVGKNIVSGLKQGISDTWSDTKSWFSNKFGSLVDNAREVFDINSPSKVFAEIGAFCMKGLSNGFVGESSSTASNFKGALADILSGVSDNESIIKDTANVLETNLCSALDTVDLKTESLGDKIRRTLGDIGVKGSADLAFNYSNYVPVAQQQRKYSNGYSDSKQFETIAQLLSDIQSDTAMNKVQSNSGSNQTPHYTIYIGDKAIDDHIVRVVKRDSKNGGNF